MYFVTVLENEVLGLRHSLVETSKRVTSVADSNTRIVATLDDLITQVDNLKSLMVKMKSSMPPKTVIVNKDGCVKSDCLAKVLLMVWELRRSFSLGTMSSDAIRSVRPLLVELNDEDIDNSLGALESFANKKGYRELKSSLPTLKNALRQTKNVGFLSYLAKWVKIESLDDPIMQDFTDLEMLVDTGAWEQALELVLNSKLMAVPKIQSWVKDLELVLSIESHLAVIHNKLIEHVNKTHEGL
ncbi:MAG: hypothetical protein AB8U44_04040 [Aaplasma endosymbiont of Hyalomma asiaticum]